MFSNLFTCFAKLLKRSEIENVPKVRNFLKRAYYIDAAPYEPVTSDASTRLETITAIRTRCSVPGGLPREIRNLFPFTRNRISSFIAQSKRVVPGGLPREIRNYFPFHTEPKCDLIHVQSEHVVLGGLPREIRNCFPFHTEPNGISFSI